MPNDHSPGSHDWMPEALLRDALIAGKLPQALRDRNLFWINVRQYLQHAHADLPPDDYLRHWEQVYACCLGDDVAALRALSYVSFEDPYAKNTQH